MKWPEAIAFANLYLSRLKSDSISGEFLADSTTHAVNVVRGLINV